MADFRFIPVTVHPQLRPYVARIWVFESSGRLPAEERKLIVPNANLKLTLTYRNGIAARVGEKNFLQLENDLTLTGLIDEPVILDPHLDSRTGTIIIEFNPLGAYRFFHLQYTALKNKILSLADLIGKPALELGSQLAGIDDTAIKIRLLQDYLIQQLDRYEADPIYDHCIRRIMTCNGHITVAQLEKESGYSARWLHRKFSEHLGIGAKGLAEIIRFGQFYHAFSTGASPENLKREIYHNYYDQSHFLRAFKQYTGTTPGDLQASRNELSVRNFNS